MKGVNVILELYLRNRNCNRKVRGTAMKLLHIGDLHIGKRVFECSMLEEQKEVLRQIIAIIKKEKPFVVLLAGDVYDKGVPSAEAVELFDEFLTELSKTSSNVLLISGNHDSPERLHFGSRIFREQGIFIAGTFEGQLQKATLEDELGTVNFYLLPYIKPSAVRPYFLDKEIKNYEDAVRSILEAEEIIESERNVILAHQFVTASGKVPERCESEILSVGGVDQIDAGLFSKFDYVALGHLHGAQKIGRETVRYAGSVLKYSFSEINHKKSVTMIELGKKGEVEIQLIALPFQRDFREIKGPLEELIKPEIVSCGNAEDYLSVILTDEEPIADPLGKLRSRYPNVMRLTFENRKNSGWKPEWSESPENLTKKEPMTLFEDFFFLQNGSKMTEQQRMLMKDLFRKTLGGDQ